MLSRSDVMTTFVKGILCAGVLVLASGLPAEQASSSSADRLFRAKLGRSSPAEEARQKAERESTAYREERMAGAALAIDWKEQYFRAKFGRSTPAEEARQKAERDSTAYRQEPAAESTAPNWLDRYFRAKFGRNSPAAEALSKAERK
jgi:hypothetical protein